MSEIVPLCSISIVDLLCDTRFSDMVHAIQPKMRTATFGRRIRSSRVPHRTGTPRSILFTTGTLTSGKTSWFPLEPNSQSRREIASPSPTCRYRSFDAGQEAFVRYGSIINSTNEPFIRASGQERVINSARAWSAGRPLYICKPVPSLIKIVGFALASTGSYNPALSVVIPEGTWMVCYISSVVLRACS